MADTTLSNAQLAAQVAALIASDTMISTQVVAWVGGTVDGGYHIDGIPSTGIGDPLAGYYPINDRLNVTHYFPSIAKLNALNTEPVAEAMSYGDFWFEGR